MAKPTLSVDFDGVIHSYVSGWKGAHVIADDPVPGAIKALLSLTDRFQVAIHSSRSKSLRGRWAMKRWLKSWLVDHFRNTEDWHAWVKVPPDWTPFTIGDADDVAREAADAVMRVVQWPWFKPAAFLTIDDRALTFDGDWSHYDAATLLAFKPWNK